jgi:MFS family permease
MMNETPLPRLQMTIVALLQITEAWNINVLFPFVVFMVRDFGVSEQSLGLYSGLLAGSFQIGQFMSATFWGRMSDKYGRKLTLVAGLSGSMVSGLLFGFSPNFPMAISSRLLSGLLNGNIGVMKSFLCVLTDDSNRTRAFSLLPMFWGLGSVIAPLAGGVLSQPARHYPQIFAGTTFEKFPYLLPVLIGTILQGIVVALTAFYMDDPTANKKLRVSPHPVKGAGGSGKLKNARRAMGKLANIWRKRQGSNQQYAAVDAVDGVEGVDNEKGAFRMGGPPPKHAGPASLQSSSLNSSAHTGSLMQQRAPFRAIMTYTTMAFCAICFDETLPLFCQTPRRTSFAGGQGGEALDEAGGGIAELAPGEGVSLSVPKMSGVSGLGFDSAEIGYVFSISGTALFLFTICVVPSLARRFGNLQGLRLGLLTALPIHVVFPLISPAQRFLPKWMFWFLIGGAVSYRQCCLTMAFTTIMVIVNNSVPASRLGEANGLAQAYAALARGVAPWMGGALWSFSLSLQSPFAVYLVYGIIAATNGLAIVFAFGLPAELERSPTAAQGDQTRQTSLTRGKPAFK